MTSAGLALVFLTSAAEARPGSPFYPNSHSGCEEDRLVRVSPRGGTLVTQSGHVFRVDSPDTVDTQFWMFGDLVFFCTGEMINKDRQGEKAAVIMMR